MVNGYLPILGSMDKAALVIPHWELLQCGMGSRQHTEPAPPKSFRELLALAKQGLARPFHCDAQALVPAGIGLAPHAAASCKQGKARWWRGIRSTDYGRWINETLHGIRGFYRIHVPPPGRDVYYEPFVVVRRREPRLGTVLPRYPEHFVGASCVVSWTEGL